MVAEGGNIVTRIKVDYVAIFFCHLQAFVAIFSEQDKDTSYIIHLIPFTTKGIMYRSLFDEITCCFRYER